MKKPNKILILFATIYNVISIYFILDLYQDQSSSLGYILTFPIFWLLGGIVLGLLFWLAKIKINTNIDSLALVFSTPGPLFLLIVIWFLVPNSQSPTSTYEFNRNKYCHRQVIYQFDNGVKKRIEYYISQDSISENNPFPTNDIWIKDSTWTFYNKDGTVEHEEQY